jgi:uncharacterized membrane protein YczE
MERWFSRRVIIRLPQVLAGIALLGMGVAMMAAGGLGFGPWSVLAEGLSKQIGVALGTADILLGIPILLLWLIVHEQPGVGTIASVFGVGLAINGGLAVLPEPSVLGWRMAMTISGVVAVGVGVALYLAADLGPGPRDGLTTGMHRRLGWSIRRVRTTIEGIVLVLGFLLGGTVGVGTVLMAFGVGAVIQAALSVFDREGRVMQQRATA